MITGQAERFAVQAWLVARIYAGYKRIQLGRRMGFGLDDGTRARLHDGRDVAVKVQYPEIAGLVSTDIRNFAVLVAILARLEPNFDFRVLVDEVTKLVPLELDFLNEAANAERMAELLKHRRDV